MNHVRPSRGVLVPFAIGVVASALTIGYALHDGRRALLAWIAAYGFAVATVLAAMVLVMVLHLTGARWWLVLRRVFVATAGTAPVFVLLFVPIGAAFTIVYPWESPPPDLSRHVEEVLEHRRVWNHPGFFLARSALYLASWTVLAVLLRRADRDHARDPASREVARFERTVSAVGLPVLGFTLTFAAFDWLMSLQPGWTSNIFGLYVFTSGLVSAMAVLAIGSWLAARSELVPEGVGPDHVHAVGRLMLMAVILWAYIGFFQLLLVWIAHLPSEVPFYAMRARGSWAGVDVVLFIGRFVLPLFVLLSRPLKRSPSRLAVVGVWLVVMSMLDFAWLAIPALGVELAWADVLPFVAVGALSWAYGAHLVALRSRRANGRDLVAADPALREALRYRSP